MVVILTGSGVLLVSNAGEAQATRLEAPAKIEQRPRVAEAMRGRCSVVAIK